MKLIKIWFPLVLYSGIIFTVSSLADLRAGPEGFGIDKILHLGEYIPFGFLAARGFWQQGRQWNAGKLLLWATLSAFLYGAGDEYHQSFVQGRSASPFDCLADTLGGAIGAWLFLKWKGPAGDPKLRE